MAKKGQLTSTSRPLKEQIDRDRRHPGDEAVLAAIEKLHAGSRLPTADGVYRVRARIGGALPRYVISNGINKLAISAPGPPGHLRIVRGKVKDPWLPLWRLVETSLCYQRRTK